METRDLRALDSDSSDVQLVVISAGTGDPSSTRLLVDRAAQKTVDLLEKAGLRAFVRVIDLRSIAVDVTRALVTGMPNDTVQSAIDSLATADAVIVGTPVYKAGISGLLKSFIDVLDNDLLIATPVILSATAGTSRHAMVVDEHLRPLFAFLRTLPVPTSLFAAPEDWSSPELGNRIERAATELALLVRSGASTSIADSAWGGYQHQFSGNAARSERVASDVDFDTDLMRLAAGGTRP